MPVYGITSKTRGLYERPAPGEYVLNAASDQAQGLVALWTLDHGNTVFRDLCRQSRHLTRTGTTGRKPVRDGGFGWANTGSTSNYLEYGAALVTAVPLTLASWCQPNGNQYGLVSINASGSYAYFGLQLGWGATNTVAAVTSDGFSTEAFAETTATYTTGTPIHACGTFGPLNRAAFLNGANRVAEATSKTPSAAALNRTTVGVARGSASDFWNPLNGSQWHVGVWNGVLADSLVWRLYDGRWRYDLLHVLGRRTFSFSQPAGGGGGTAVPVFLHHYRQMGVA